MGVTLYDGFDNNLSQLIKINSDGSLKTQAVPQAFSAAIISATGALTLIKGTAGTLWGMYFLNNTATASWIQFFDSATTGGVTLGSTSPVWAAPIASLGILYVPPGIFGQLAFVNGIVYAATSLLGGNTTESQSGTVEFS